MLTAQQTDAVTSDASPLLIIAGAGAGKTTVLIQRVLRLLRQGLVAPSRCLLVTFTRAAVAELVERLEHELDGRLALPEVSTIHGWAARVVRRFAPLVGLKPSFTIYDERDSRDVLLAVCADLGVSIAAERALAEDRRVALEYRRALRAAGAVDFDGLERLARHLLVTHEHVRGWVSAAYDAVLVDEYQDTSLTQAWLLSQVAVRSFTAVGDPRQLIYAWRQADPVVLDRLQALARTVYLPHNFRSTPAIVEHANAINPAWRPMEATQPAGPCVETRLVDDLEIAAAEAVKAELRAGTHPDEVMVLCRRWAPLVELHERFEAEGVPSVFHGADDDPWATPEALFIARLIRFYRARHDQGLAAMVGGWPHRQELAYAVRQRRDLDGLTSLSQADPRWATVARRWDEMSFHAPRHALEQRVTLRQLCDETLTLLQVRDDLTARGLITRMRELDRALDLLDDVPATSPLRFTSWWFTRQGAAADVGVDLRSVHSAKGLEADVVILYGASTKAFSPEDEEAQRLLYVAATRARRRLIILASEDSGAASPLLPHPPQPWSATALWGGPIGEFMLPTDVAEGKHVCFLRPGPASAHGVIGPLPPGPLTPADSVPIVVTDDEGATTTHTVRISLLLEPTHG